jgi:hypothetical protein
MCCLKAFVRSRGLRQINRLTAQWWLEPSDGDRFLIDGTGCLSNKQNGRSFYIQSYYDIFIGSLFVNDILLHERRVSDNFGLT